MIRTDNTMPASTSSNDHRATPGTDTTIEELSHLKRQLLQAEVRLAKARATSAGAEVDVKVLNARLRAHTR